MQTSLAHLSDKALVAAVEQCCLDGKKVLARLIVLLIEVEERRVDLKSAYPSMFEFCRRELRMSEGEAFRRLNAARLVKRFPKLLPRIACGDIHLSALVQLRDYFHDANVDHLVDAAKGKNKFEIAELVARLAPRPGGRGTVRKLPHHDRRPNVSRAKRPSLEPLSEAVYRLHVFGDRAFRDKLFRARDMLMHSNPTGDLSVVIARAIDELIVVLEKRRYGSPRRRASEGSVDPVVTTAMPKEVQPTETKPTTAARVERGPSIARVVGKSERGAEQNQRRRNEERNRSANGAMTRGDYFRPRNGAALKSSTPD